MSRDPFISDKTQQIAFLGTERGCGTTFMSIAAANYLAQWENEKIAHVSMSGRRETEKLREYEKGECFTIYGVTYYPSADNYPDLLVILKNSGYSRIITDLGEISDESLNEFKRCDLRFLIGGLDTWKLEEQIELIDKIEHNFHLTLHNHYLFLAFGGSIDNKKLFARTTGIPTLSVPPIADPMDIKKQERDFFKKILG